MNRKDLLEGLRGGVAYEEGASAAYLQHLSAISEKCALGEEQLKVVRERINFLVETNKSHRERLLAEIARIEGAAGDEF